MQNDVLYVRLEMVYCVRACLVLEVKYKIPNFNIELASPKWTIYPALTVKMPFFGLDTSL